MKIYKYVLIFIFSLFSLCYALDKNLQIEYIKGSVEDKTLAVKKAGENGDVTLALTSIDFALENYELTGEDKELINLLRTSVEVLTKNKGLNESQISSKLGKIFTTYKDSSLRIATLEALSEYPSSNSVSILNAFVSEKIQKNEPMDEVLENAIKCLSYVGNKTSFNLLFLADILEIWQGSSELLESAFGPLASSSENEILNILSKVTVDLKLKVLEIVTKNKQISENVKGEVAQNALSDAIYSIGNSAEYSEQDVKLQLAALEVVAKTKWTRASNLATEYFSIAANEYAHDVITTEEFTKVIQNVASVATSDTGRKLSSYLEELNKRMEAGNPPEDAVVLAVINALGGLGDKAAFDYLLYVTYLDYPQTITTAARNALAKLKW